MRKLSATLVIASAMVCLFGCALLKKADPGADAAADAAPLDAEVAAVLDAAPVTLVITAKNAADVARFPAESAVTDDDLKLASVGIARSAPKTGTVVATLKAGTDVVKLAEYQSAILVTFADPKDASSSLMGWIGSEAFAASVASKRDGGASDAAAPVVDAGAPKADAGAAKADASAPVVDAGTKPACAAGSVSVMLGGAPVCRKRCASDAACKVGTAAGVCANATTTAGSVAKVCSNL